MKLLIVVPLLLFFLGILFGALSLNADWVKPTDKGMIFNLVSNLSLGLSSAGFIRGLIRSINEQHAKLTVYFLIFTAATTYIVGVGLIQYFFPLFPELSVVQFI